MSMGIMEAMATGKPMVAQRNGGVPEIVEDGVEGFLFKIDSIDHMVGNVERLIVDRDVRETMGKKALERSAALAL